MREADIQTIFKKWAQNNWYSPAAFELKLAKGTSMAFNHVAPHQLDALKIVKDTGLFHKITDQPWLKDRPAFTAPKPFDCFVLKGQAFVCICWYIPRRRKTVYFIDVDDFLQLRDTCGRKSLTESMAKETASFEVELTTWD